VDHLITDISTDSLRRLATALEAKLIAGRARADDIDAYIRVQWEIADREIGRDPDMIDPRD
jgi:hypothetical protein